MPNDVTPITPKRRRAEQADADLHQARMRALRNARVLARHFDLESCSSGDVAPLDPEAAQAFESLAQEIIDDVERLYERAAQVVAMN